MNKILSCNYPLVVRDFDRIPEQYLTSDYRTKFDNYQKYFYTSKFFYDRTGTIPYYLNVDSSAYPIPDANGFNLNFSEVVEKRAKELLSLGKRINVSWSGGIDSTFILLTLYHYANDKSQIKVYGTYSSVIESGDLFDRYIKNNIDYDIHVNNIHYKDNYQCSDNEIFVTGSNGNDIFYPSNKFSSRDEFLTHMALNQNNDVHTDWKKVLPESTLEFLDPFLKKSPRPLDTVQDLRWWVSFAFNWYSTRTNSYIGLDKTRSHKIHSFFSSDDWQRWSMTNKDPATKTGDFKDDRWQLREMIHYYTGIGSYFNKNNYTSVLSSFGPSWLFLLNDYSNIYLQDL
jgi:hypothetical protein